MCDKYRRLGLIITSKEQRAYEVINGDYFNGQILMKFMNCRLKLALSHFDPPFC